MQDQSQSTDLPSLSPEPTIEPVTNPGPTVPVTSGPPPPDTTSGASSQGAVQAPAGAADNDLIEKEWVLKAKEIVAKTSGDPFTQQKEIERFKADYMKKRYNKTIRTTDT
jgi:hypothetical protein